MLYGSQNFGYDTELSDKDYLQFILPTWDNIVNNKLISYETKSNIDNGIIKVKDIRLIKSMISKANVNDLQFLFAQEQKNTEILNWFYSHKQELVRINLPYIFKSNQGYIISQLKDISCKSVSRAFATLNILKDIAEEKEVVFNKSINKKYIKENDIKILEKAAENIKYELNIIQDYFLNYKNTEKEQLLYNDIVKELKRILKNNL